MLSMCLVAISLILPPEGETSKSYASRFMRGADHRVQNCLRLIHLSKKMEAPTLLVLAIASVESGFKSKQVSSAGAQGLIGVMPSNMVGRNKKAYMAWEIRGIEILKYLLKTRDLCDSLSFYNAGKKGACDKVTGGGYAKVVMDRYYKLCALWDKKECYAC